MKNKFFKTAYLGLALSASCLVNIANAGIIFYTSDPTNNSSNWSNDALTNSYEVNSNINFDSHALGSLDSSFYLLSDGVSINSSGISNQAITNGVGPGQGSTGTDTGEGLHQSSNFLDINNSGVLTLSFSEGAYSAGVTTIDVWSGGDFTINVFSGIDGTGSLLSSVSGVAEGLNFQQNRKFFMGVSTNDLTKFGSIQFDFSGDGGDDIGYDDILFASKRTEVPEPSTLAIFALGMIGLASRRFKKQS